MRVLICGSRNWGDAKRIRNVLRRLPRGTTLISGAARGADSMAATIGRSLGFKVIEFQAEWDRYGRSAGPIRNKAMLEKGKPDKVIAFWDGKSTGTAHMMEVAKRAGVPVRVVRSK